MDSVGDHKKIAPGPNLYSNLKARNQSLFAVSIVFILSAVVRIVFFSGFFGSDDFTYYSAAYGIVEKKMEVGNYIGGIRYGVNLPMAFFIGIFGSSEFIGNLWSLITSSLEVALVYYMARSWWGERAGISAALLLMLMPIHVHYGGRIMADAPLALFISLSFCLFWFAKEKRKSILYFLSGCVLGWVFWIKATVAVLVHLAFIPNLLMLVKQEGMKKVWIVAVGSMLVVGLNFLFFWVFKGDPFHLIKSIHAATSKYSHVSFESHPLYYAEYLFLKIYHTWIIGYLFVLSLMAYCFSKRFDSNVNYTIVWCLSLIFILTFFLLPSGDFIAKQVNYMLIFMAPMVLICSYFLSILNMRAYFSIMVFIISGSLALSYLEQINIRSFTANARAIAYYSSGHPDMTIFSSTLPYRFSSHLSKYDPKSSVSSVKYLDREAVEAAVKGGEPIYLAIDPMSFEWATEEFSLIELKSSSVLVGKYSSSSGEGLIEMMSEVLSRNESGFIKSFGEFVKRRFIPRKWELYRMEHDMLN